MIGCAVGEAQATAPPRGASGFAQGSKGAEEGKQDHRPTRAQSTGAGKRPERAESHCAPSCAKKVSRDPENPHLPGLGPT